MIKHRIAEVLADVVAAANSPIFSYKVPDLEYSIHLDQPDTLMVSAVPDLEIIPPLIDPETLNLAIEALSIYLIAESEEKVGCKCG